MGSQVTSIALIACFTLLSGLGDALGFIHAGRVWQEGRFVWSEAAQSAAGFQFGVAMYWVALHFLAARGVIAVEMQTIFWFGATLIGIAILSREFLRWPASDQAVAFAVLAGIGWLLVRNAQREIS
jgi:hypothetical protein